VPQNKIKKFTLPNLHQYLSKFGEYCASPKFRPWIMFVKHQTPSINHYIHYILCVLICFHICSFFKSAYYWMKVLHNRKQTKSVKKCFRKNDAKKILWHSATIVQPF
jgi:hypothetical protein